MGICCKQEIICDNKKCKLSEDERLSLFYFKDEFIRKITSTSRIHNIPVEKLDELNKNCENLKRLIYGMYFLANIIFDTNSEEHQTTYKQFFSEMENAFIKFMMRAQMRSITMGKHTVGFFGHFDSGKSAMLNRILSAEFKLPEDNKPSTAVPTYILHANTNKLVFENKIGRISEEEDMGVLKYIKHTDYPCGFPWASVLNRIYCFSKQVNNPNVVYIDLPGISNDKTDNEKAYNDIVGCDEIVYLIPQDQGSLSTKDIESLKRISAFHIPILIVLTKVDRIPTKAARNIYQKIKNDLTEHEIKYTEFIMYSIYPEKIEKLDKDFYCEIIKNQKVIEKFLNKQVNTQDDLDEILACVGKMYKRFDQADDYLRDLSKTTNSTFESFEGEQELTKSFFERWEAIEKQIYSSDQKFITKETFFKNAEFDTFEFINSIAPSINNFFNKETDVYNSLFNWSFIRVGYLSSLQYLWEVACRATATKKFVTSESYQKEQEFINQIKKNYTTIKDTIQTIHQQSLKIPVMLIDELIKTQNNATEYWEKFKDCYLSLINLSKQKHKEWSD